MGPDRGNDSAHDALQDVPQNTALTRSMFLADPSAHVLNGSLYVYPSHDPDDANPKAESPDERFAMRDYHVFQVSQGKLVDKGTVLRLEDVPWASRALWAPDIAVRNGTYHFYFPAEDHEGKFRIGVANAPTPTGPFKVHPRPIPGSFSIDPCAFTDDDGKVYLYFGGLMGGQMEDVLPEQDHAFGPWAAELAEDMVSFRAPPKEVLVVDRQKKPLMATDESRRFFEAAWMHKFNGTYYLSYSTGTTHNLVYATGSSPRGPFEYRGVLLHPVSGWTTHHSIVKVDGLWWLFYHDVSVSGQQNKRSMKVVQLCYGPAGEIVPRVEAEPEFANGESGQRQALHQSHHQHHHQSDHQSDHQSHHQHHHQYHHQYHHQSPQQDHHEHAEHHEQDHHEHAEHHEQHHQEHAEHHEQHPHEQDHHEHAEHHEQHHHEQDHHEQHHHEPLYHAQT